MKQLYLPIVFVLATVDIVKSGTVAYDGLCDTSADCVGGDGTNPTSECQDSLGSTCTKGTCKCRPEYKWDSTASQCKLRKYYLDQCYSTTTCLGDHTCTSGQCTCAGSHNSKLQLCLPSAKKAIGEVCTGTDTLGDCYESATLPGSVECIVPTGSSATTKYCTCKTGYIQEDHGCRKPKYAETGCTTTVGCASPYPSQFTGDASVVEETCISGKCQCVSSTHTVKYIRIYGYRVAFCVENYSGTTIAQGSTCTETKQCASGFCYKCPESASDKTCVPDNV